MGSGASRCNVSFIVEETVFVHHNVLNGRNFRSRGGRPGLSRPLVRMVSVDVKQHLRTELGSCVKVEVDVLGSPSLIVCTVSVDVKRH